MSTLIKKFQEKKEMYKEEEWIVVTETGNRMEFFDSKKCHLYSLTGLLEESETFLKENREIQFALLTRFKAENQTFSIIDADDQIELECHVHGQTFLFTAFVDNIEQEKRESIYTHLTLPESTETIDEKRLDEHTKRILRKVFYAFKEFVSQYSAYRLYFITRHLTFDEEDVLCYIDSKERT